MTKKIKFIPLVLTAVTLAGCNKDSKTTDQTIKWITPVGAPTLAFASELGRNPNYETNPTPNLVASELQMNRKDAVVFDSINGLKSIKKNGSEFKLTRLVTGGNICLAGIGKADGDVPQNGEKVIAYGENLVPDQVFKKLCTDYWHVELDVTYVSGNADVIAALKGTETEYDWAVIAQPGVFNVNAATQGKLTTYTQLRTTWASYTAALDGVAEQKYIPQAGVFVRNSTIENKAEGLASFYETMDNNINNSLHNVENVATIMNAYGDAKQQAAAFGYNVDIMKQCQGDEKNEFGLVAKDEIENASQYITDFIKVLTGEDLDYGDLIAL